MTHPTSHPGPVPLRDAVCQTCNDERSLIVGWSQVPRSTYKIKWERDPCPRCTPPPHSLHAKLVAARKEANQ